MDIDTTIPSDKTEPEPDWVLESRGHQLLDDGKFAQARAIFSELAQRSPAERGGHAGLAWTAERQWRWADAIAHWDECIAIGDQWRDDAVARKAVCLAEMGQIKEAARLLTLVSYRPAAAEDLARLIVAQEPYPAARQAWENIIGRFPSRIEGFLGKARLLIQRESYGEAEAFLSAVLTSWPDSVSARVLHAQCATALKNWPVANERWRNLVARHGGASEVQTGYARYLAVIGDHAALTVFLAQLSQQPGTAPIECLLEYHLARDDYGAAAQQARLLVEAQPKRLEYRFRQADVLLRHGATAELHAALWILKQLYREAPDAIWVRIRLISTLIRTGDRAQTESLIETLPQEDRRAEIEILRAWRQHLHGQDVAAQDSWKGVLDRIFVPAVHAAEGRLTRVDQGHAESRPGDILLFAAVRDEAPRLPWLLDYYRKLGVDKFIIVDNDSTDGTAELLLRQPDVVLYHTSDRYGMAAWGVRWINALIDKHGRNNWCVYVDADEALIYPDSETVGLRALTEALSKKGQQAMLAPLLDMHPATVPHSRDIEELQRAYCYFDSDLYARDHFVCPYREFYGGVRRRLFDGYQLLTKVPLIDGSSGARFLISTHRTTPVKMATMTGALLHYHLITILQPEYQALLEQAIEAKEFPSASLERLRSRELLPKVLTRPSLLGEGSVKFESTRQLVELGIINADRTASEPEMPTDALRRLARATEKAGDWNKAAAIYEKITARRDGTFWDRYFQVRGLIYGGQTQRAAELMAKLSAQGVDAGACALLNAELLERSGPPEAAVVAWEAALRQGAGNYWCLFGKARVLAQTDKIEEARKTMEEALLSKGAEEGGLAFALELDVAAGDFVRAEQRLSKMQTDPHTARLKILRALPGMTSYDERLAIYEAVRDLKVSGAIVDLGCGIGSLTVAMASALQERSDNGHMRVHAFDQFEWVPSYMDQLWKNSFPGCKLTAGESFLPLFQHFTRPWADRIEPVAADLSRVSWDGPIALLSVDAMKTFDLSKSIIAKFFPHLVPGGLLLHLDYCSPRTWWVQIYQYFFRDRFELTKVTVGSDGVWFRLLEPITVEEIVQAVEHDLSNEVFAEEVFAYSLQVMPPQNRNRIHQARAEYYRYREEARTRRAGG